MDAPRFWIIDPSLKAIIDDPASSEYKLSIMQPLNFRLMFSPLMSPDEHIHPFQETGMGSIVGPVPVALSSKEEMVYLVWNPRDAAVFKCEEVEVCLDQGKGYRDDRNFQTVPIERANDVFAEHFRDDPEIVDFLNRFHVRLRALELRQKLLETS